MMNEETTPDSLMAHFKGRSLMSVAMFTLIVHVVVILGSSIPFLVRTAMSAGTSEGDQEQRLASAVQDATEALREIAEKHGLSPQDISEQFSGGGSLTRRAVENETVEALGPEMTVDSTSTPDRVKSAYETNLETTVKGPKVPTFNDDKDDIF